MWDRVLVRVTEHSQHRPEQHGTCNEEPNDAVWCRGSNRSCAYEKQLEVYSFIDGEPVQARCCACKLICFILGHLLAWFSSVVFVTLRFWPFVLVDFRFGTWSKAALLRITEVTTATFSAYSGMRLTRMSFSLDRMITRFMDGGSRHRLTLLLQQVDDLCCSASDLEEEQFLKLALRQSWLWF